MKKLSVYVIKLLSVGLLLFLVYCGKNPTMVGSGLETQNALVMGHIYKGNSPAIGAKVFFVPVGHNPNPAALGKALASTDTVTTGSTGTYGTNDLDSGTYNVFGQDNSGNLSLIDSVHVTGDSQVVPPDTLKLPGSLAGFIKMQGRDDPASVLIMPFGTFIKPDPTPSTGAFSLSNLAEGWYSIRFMSILDRYEKLDTTFEIKAGQPLILPDSIRLPLKIPTPTGLKVFYDTLRQIVTLSWDKMDTSRVKGYNVYRQRIDTSEVKLNALPLANPFYVDSTGIQGQTYIYSVVAVDFEDKPGIRTTGDSIKITGLFTLLQTWGTLGTGPGQMNGPMAIATDNQGLLYVADANNNRIQVFDNTGHYMTEFGNSILSQPCDIAVYDSFLFIATYSNKKVYTFSLHGDSLSEFNLANNASFPHITVDSSNIYIIPNASYDSVQIYDRTGSLLRAFPLQGDYWWGIHAIGDRLFIFNGRDTLIQVFTVTGVPQGAMVLGPGRYPVALTEIGDTVFVLNGGKYKSGVGVTGIEVLVYNSSNQYLGRWGGDTGFTSVSDFTSDPLGNIYILDQDGRKIWKFSRR